MIVAVGLLHAGEARYNADRYAWSIHDIAIAPQILCHQSCFFRNLFSNFASSEECFDDSKLEQLRYLGELPKVSRSGPTTVFFVVRTQTQKYMCSTFSEAMYVPCNLGFTQSWNFPAVPRLSHEHKACKLKAVCTVVNLFTALLREAAVLAT